MALQYTDLPLDQLHAYAPELPEPDDLDAFWAATIAEARAAGDGATRTAVDGPVRTVIVEDLTFPGFGGDPVRGWVLRPRDGRPAPAVVEFVGYGGGRGLPGERLAWSSAGYVHVIMDTRGQGSGWSLGDTPDPHGSGPAASGVMTRGIHDPRTYYYRRVFTDAVRLVDAVATMPFVDPDRIVVTGGSQGGGIAIAAAALSSRVAAVLPDVPFLCDFPRAITHSLHDPFTEIARYLAVHRDEAEAVRRTLSYVDGAVLARRVTAPALVSVALMDEIVLPSTVFAAFHALGSADKTLEVYEFNGHEGGGMHHWLRQTDWLAGRW
ncbi:acetylxylan esterase [Microbacterium sp. MMO-20]|uniref:acetylxylan esterase n=1 Tax=unclassified Microbacterium TaxID=2609290 RepID=UPI003FA5C5A6